jgi:hypothetical protein
VRRGKARHLQRVRIPPGNCRSSRKHSERFEEVTTWTEALQEKAPQGSASRQAVTRVNAEQAPKRVRWEPTWRENGEGRCLRETASEAPEGPTGVLATACVQEERTGNTGNPSGTEM